MNSHQTQVLRKSEPAEEIAVSGGLWERVAGTASIPAYQYKGNYGVAQVVSALIVLQRFIGFPSRVGRDPRCTLKSLSQYAYDGGHFAPRGDFRPLNPNAS